MTRALTPEQLTTVRNIALGNDTKLSRSTMQQVLDATEEAQTIVRGVAEDQPLYVVESPNRDFFLCHWCRASGPHTGPADMALERGFTHKPDCLWLRARAFCGMGEK